MSKNKTKILASIACNLDTEVLAAALPLFQEESVEAIEWSFDTLHQTRNIPAWFTELLSSYGEANRLIGHGVFFSIFSGRWSEDQTYWLKHLRKVCQAFHFEHITEHFGFMTGADFHKGAPVPIPLTDTTLAIGIDRLQRIQEACRRPVGLENLAFSYALEDVKKHGVFLYRLVEAIDGFIILDLHNLYCHMHNFNISLDEILGFYHLEDVREIHISGGTWEESEVEENKKIRRDTHDESVPDMVFEMLEKVIPQCPHLKYVVLEQIGSGLETEADKISFRADYQKMRNIIANSHTSLSQDIVFRDFIPTKFFTNKEPLQSEGLYQEQLLLSSILEKAVDYETTIKELQVSALSNSDWNVEAWEPRMVQTLIAIAQKWKDGFIKK
jgi:uncharacterized protein (UPF0276 family)